MNVQDPNTPGFFTGDVLKTEQIKLNHPAFRAPDIEVAYRFLLAITSLDPSSV